MIKLEDGLKYYITKEIKNNNIIYVYLTNVLNVNDFCIRKTDDSKEELITLDDENEFNLALKLYENAL